MSRSVFLSVPGENILGDPGAVSRVGRRRDESFQVRARHSWSTLSMVLSVSVSRGVTLRSFGCCSYVVVDDDQEHHARERLGVVFMAVADQSNTGTKGCAAFRTLVSFLSRCQGDLVGFAQLTLPLSPCYPVLLEEDSVFVDFATPGRSL